MGTDISDNEYGYTPYHGEDYLRAPFCRADDGAELTLDGVGALFTANERSAQLDALLSSSLFYYCSGFDPTPVAAFECKPSVYIFVDSFRHIRAEFDTGMGILQKRIAALGYDTLALTDLPAVGILSFASRARLFRFASCEGKFFLLYLRAIDADAYRGLFLDGEDALDRYARHRACPWDGEDKAFIPFPVPECVCNFRYEGRSRLMERAEALSPFILGHAFGERYSAVADYPYLGDYGGDGQRVTLWCARDYEL